MYSCVFWCKFIDLVGFTYGCYCLTPVTLFIIRSNDKGQTITAKKKTTKSMSSHLKTQEYIKGKSPLFIL